MTLSTMFGLIAVTGMRIGEALALHDADVDTSSAVIRVRHAKNGRDRVIPVTVCTAERLRMHRDTRNRILGRATEAFFCGMGGGRLAADTPRYNFAKISQRIGLREPQAGTKKGRGPRLHDLRHNSGIRLIPGRPVHGYGELASLQPVA